jgi:phosphohistidine phosphatase SixA
MSRRTFLIACTLLATSQACLARDDSEQLWRQLQTGNKVILMRHAATVPGTGDPAGFRLGDCSTQRNLSSAGRSDAVRIGAAFRQNKIAVTAVLSSRWCRCLDTARLAFGKVQPAPMLDSMFLEDATEARPKLESLRAYLLAHRAGGTLVLVTHDVNIRGLIGRYLGQGELAVTTVKTDGTLDVAGVLSVPDMLSSRP